MRVVAPVDQARETIVGLAEAAEIGLWDDESGVEMFRPNPGLVLSGGRRLAAMEVILSLEADIVCSVPQALCTASYAVARTAGCRFLMLEVDTPVRLVREYARGMASAAVSELIPTWIATPGHVAPAPAPPAERAMALPDGISRALLNRLRRIEGQVRGVQRLIQEQRDCDSIMTQVAAMRSAVNAVGMVVLSENLAQCLARPADSLDADDSVERAKRAFLRLN